MTMRHPRSRIRSRVLEEVGLWLPNRDVLERLHDVGGLVDFDAMTVWLPPALMGRQHPQNTGGLHLAGVMVQEDEAGKVISFIEASTQSVAEASREAKEGSHEAGKDALEDNGPRSHSGRRPSPGVSPWPVTPGRWPEEAVKGALVESPPRTAPSFLRRGGDHPAGCLSPTVSRVATSRREREFFHVSCSTGCWLSTRGSSRLRRLSTPWRSSGTQTDSHARSHKARPHALRQRAVDTYPRLDVLVVSPSVGTTTRRLAFLHGVRRTLFPRFVGTIKALRRLPPVPPRFVSFAWRYHRARPEGVALASSIAVFGRFAQPWSPSLFTGFLDLISPVAPSTDTEMILPSARQ